jgi:hypothetical protein
MLYPTTFRLAAIQRRRIAFWDAIHEWERVNRTGGSFARLTWADLRRLYARTRHIA